MDDKVVNLINYKEKIGNPNVDIAPHSEKEMIEGIKNILKENRIILKDFSYGIENYPVNEEISVGEEITGGGNMSNNDYVTENDLKSLEERLEQKINFNQEILIQKIDGTKNEFNLKFDNQLLEFKNLLNTKFNEQRDKQDANKKWIITTIIATSGVLFAALKIFL